MTEFGTVSVCMATYNGAAYVERQLRTILDDLRPGDEVVVVDDASGDDTRERVEAIADPRVRLIAQRQNRGYVRTFEAALLAARGDVLLLADQDDEWISGHRDRLAAAATASGFAASNLLLLGSGKPLPAPFTGRPWRLAGHTSSQSLRNVLRILGGMAPYFGCAMAVRRDHLDAVTPFPAFLDESHDLWIALVANSAHRMTHVAAPTVRRRLHDANASASTPRGWRKVAASRLMLVRAWAAARRRARQVPAAG
ncbi:glycosyltransferase [Microbacterium enclense]|uniref:glycosyltransferase n=1 Tax=Microbacterium enclense TaxID=993073 RepID=UPI003F7D62AC